MISISTHRCKDSNKVCIAIPREIMSKSWNSFNINKILSFSKILYSSLGKIHSLKVILQKSSAGTIQWTSMSNLKNNINFQNLKTYFRNVLKIKMSIEFWINADPWVT